MKRKLVQQGASTMMISLPSKWVKENKLGKGSEVELEEKNSKIIIGLEAEKTKKDIEINLSSLTESSVRTVITNVYRLGYDKIKINFKDKSVLKTIQEILNKNLIGFEITKRTDSFCEIENITEPSREQFDNIFSKIFLNIDELLIIAEQALQNKKVEFEEIERKIQQFDNFCRRVIAKNNSNNFDLVWAFHSELIHGQREIYHMLRFTAKNKIKTDKETLLMLEHCKKIFEKLKEAYTKKDIALLEHIHSLEKEIIYKEGYRAINKSNNPVVIHHLMNAIRNFYLASSPLIGITIVQGEEEAA